MKSQAVVAFEMLRHTPLKISVRVEPRDLKFVLIGQHLEIVARHRLGQRRPVADVL